MSATLKPPDAVLQCNEAAEEAADLRHFNRSPHPYARHGLAIRQSDEHDSHERRAGAGAVGDKQERSALVSEDETRQGHSKSASLTGSESGTEADDERPAFVKALPAPTLRPRKGWKGGNGVGDGALTPLLTPSQLDDEGRRLSQGFFWYGADGSEDRQNVEEDAKAAQEKLYRRRLAEFLRRTSEVALLGVIAISVLFGTGVWREVWRWHRVELLAHATIVVTLVAAYPLRLSFLTTGTRYSKPWQRFRVPASFDPATILYPTFLPVLVALSVLPANSAILLPNVVLGLSALPQRLFPRASRFNGINAVHWFVTILPLVAAKNATWPSDRHTPVSSKLKTGPLESLASETIVTLYPLHQALLPPLHYLTTTSLLSAELQLLSTSLVNLLLFARSPQASILSICLWVGGLALFVTCYKVLHWNVTLARVPKWKLRRSGPHKHNRQSLVEAVREVLSLKHRGLRFGNIQESPESDADEEDEDERVDSPIANDRPRLSITSIAAARLRDFAAREPKSAIEPRQTDLESRELGFEHEYNRQRRNTLPDSISPDLLHIRASKGKRQRTKSSSLLWCLNLTPAQAEQRKWLYAGYIFATILVLILGPVRFLVSEKALHGNEPIGWALGYLFGNLPQLRTFVASYSMLYDWIVLPTLANRPLDLRTILSEGLDAFRWDVGPANTRLLIFAYWALVLVLGLLAVFALTAHVEVDTRRKVFHAVMVAMLLPATFVDPCFCALALALVLAVFLLLEAIRAGQVPPLGNAIGRFVAPYVDGRDLRGPVVVSHIFLLIGCAVPLWFSLAAIDRAGDSPWQGWELAENTREVAMIAGVVCVGMGDAAASLIGRRFGRHKWIWIGGKSLEGSAAFAVAVTVGLMATKAWLTFGSWRDIGQKVGPSAPGWLITLVKAGFCGCGASFMEAVLTGANDNVVVPVALWLLVKGVRV